MEVFTENYIRETYSSKTKISLIISIINTYCSATYLNRNIWMIEKIVESLKEIESCAHKPQDTIHAICKLISYIKQNPKKDFVAPIENIQHMLYSSLSSNTDISFMHDLVSDDSYTLLSILYMNLKQMTDLNSSIAITKYILDTSPVSKELDSYDCMFVFILNLIDHFNLEPKIKKYITSCKDLFYYRLRKKDRHERANLIYYSIYVMISRHVSNRPLVAHNVLVHKLNENDFTPRIDPNIANEMEQLRLSCNKNNNTKKVIIMEDYSYKGITINKLRE